ncbi:hypothetical protein [Streptomyces sp. NBC_00448]|uniref:hypothetical protein n=1 Tax=Streptomyces sp. NBC_00448 TaxID=2903652 RepID=UPI002E1DB467
MTDKESAADLRSRAQTLRSCATRARTAAKALGTYLDGEVKTATGVGPALIWVGPYATDTTSTLQQRQASLQRMASELLVDAKRWEGEAGHLEDRAQKKHGAH